MIHGVCMTIFAVISWQRFHMIYVTNKPNQSSVLVPRNFRARQTNLSIRVTQR